MDLRRTPRTVINPKVLQVGFVTRGAPPPPVRSHSVLTDARPTFPTLDISLSGSSLSPVMIPPPCHTSVDGLPSLALSATSLLPVSTSPLRRDTVKISMGSYNTSEFFLSSSPTMSPSSRLDAGSELSDEVPTGGGLKDS